MNDRRKAITVKVTIHLTADGQYAVGVITQEWQGAVRLDRRLARLRPVEQPDFYPWGVDRHVYDAWLALGDLVDSQRTPGGPLGD